MFSGGSFSVLGEYIFTLCTQIDKMPEVKPATLSSTQRAYVPLSYAPHGIPYQWQHRRGLAPEQKCSWWLAHTDPSQTSIQSCNYFC